MLKIDIDELRDIGWSHWDPIGLLRQGQNWQDVSFKDEYDGYLRRIAKKVLAGIPEGQIVAYAIGSAHYAMNGGTGKRRVRDAVNTVRAVAELIEKSRGPKRPTL